MSKFGGVPVETAGTSKFGGVPVEQNSDYSGGLQGVRAGLQGLSFGLSDEVTAATAALGAKIFDGADFTDAYSTIQKQLGDKRDSFSADNPVLSTGLEVAGGLLTGGIGGAKALGGQAMKQASNLGKMGRISGIGAVEGGIYGAGSANQGERLAGGAQGAALGGALAPLGAGAVNALGKVGGSVTNYAADKLTKTPTTQAQQVLRDTADAVGLSADDIVKRVKALGPEGTITDSDDAFRSVARAGMNRQGTMSDKGKTLANTRQKAQQKRLMGSIESISGKSSEYNSTLKGIVKRRSDEAAPLYGEAHEIGMEMTEGLAKLKADPLFKRAFNQGEKWAKSDGDDRLLNQLHHAKLNLDDQIGSAIRSGEGNKARILMKKKTELMGEIGSQNPKYLEAAEVYADESALKNAMELGRDILKKDPEEIQELLNGMTKGEAELFRLGGVKALADRFDKVGNNQNAVSKIMNQPRTRKQLSLVLGDDAGAFLKRAGIEEEFTQTRGALTGNSTTAAQQQAGKSLDNSIDAGVLEAVVSGGPTQVISKVVQIATKGQATPETIDALGSMMFKQGMSEKEVRRIFQSSPVRRAFGDEYDEIVAPYIRGAIAPAVITTTQ